MADKEYNIQELVHRDVYVNDKKVGTIVGERHHPNEARVQSMRIQVESDVADEYMRKPAELAPLPKELVHSIQTDGTVKLSKSMRELQRRWRNTIRIDEKLYAPDEMLDRAVLDNQGREVGNEGWNVLEIERPPLYARELARRDFNDVALGLDLLLLFLMLSEGEVARYRRRRALTEGRAVQLSGGRRRGAWPTSREAHADRIGEAVEESTRE